MGPGMQVGGMWREFVEVLSCTVGLVTEGLAGLQIGCDAVPHGPWHAGGMCGRMRGVQGFVFVSVELYY
jgi:hypothetical protein